MGVNILPYCYPTASRLRFEPGPFCACHRLSPGWLGSRVVSVLYMYSQSIGSQTGKVLSTLAANEESSQFFFKNGPAWTNTHCMLTRHHCTLSGRLKMREFKNVGQTARVESVGPTPNLWVKRRGSFIIDLTDRTCRSEIRQNSFIFAISQ